MTPAPQQIRQRVEEAVDNLLSQRTGSTARMIDGLRWLTVDTENLTILCQALVDLAVQETRQQLLEEVGRAPKFFPQKRGWRGKGYGEVAPDRRVIRHDSDVDGHYIQVMDDTDGMAIGFTVSQARKLIAALQKAVDDNPKLAASLQAGVPQRTTEEK